MNLPEYTGTRVPVPGTTQLGPYRERPQPGTAPVRVPVPREVEPLRTVPVPVRSGTPLQIQIPSLELVPYSYRYQVPVGPGARTQNRELRVELSYLTSKGPYEGIRATRRAGAGRQQVGAGGREAMFKVTFAGRS